MQPSWSALFKQFSAPRFWPVWFLVGWLRLLTWLPLPVIYCLGAALGEAAYWLHPPRRDITRRNLTACFPRKSAGEIRALARGHFRSMVIAVLATGIGWWGGKARLDRLTRFHNRAVFDRARDCGENLILLAPHFTGLEYGGIYLSTIAPTVSMYQHNKNPLLDALIVRHRSRFGILQYDRKLPIQSLIRLIRRGSPFYYLPDQDPGRKHGVFAPFFGVPAATFATLGRIARLGDATILPCMTRILPWGRGFEIRFGAPLTGFPCGDAVLDATAMNRAVERLIADAPAQYFWSHRRFKTRPAGAPPFYS